MTGYHDIKTREQVKKTPTDAGERDQMGPWRPRGGGSVSPDHVHPVPNTRHHQPHRYQQPLGTGWYTDQVCATSIRPSPINYVGKKNPFTCSEYVDYPRSCFHSTWRGTFELLPLPFPILDLVNMQLIWLFGYRWTPVYQNSFFLVNGLPMKRTADTWTTYYPVALVWYIVFSAPAYLNIAQNIWSLFYSNPCTGRVGWVIFSLYLCESALTVTSQICLPILRNIL